MAGYCVRLGPVEPASWWSGGLSLASPAVRHRPASGGLIGFTGLVGMMGGFHGMGGTLTLVSRWSHMIKNRGLGKGLRIRRKGFLLCWLIFPVA